jgi:flavorubredoxin
MWGRTEKMAKAILEGVREEGINVKLMNISSTGRSAIMKEVLDAKALIIGSPTINNGMYPTVADFLCYMKGLRPQGKMGTVFGSFGWGGGATKAITEEMQATGIELVEPALQFQFLPSPEEFDQCRELGRKMAARVKAALS